MGERLSRDLIEPVRSRLPPGIRRLLISPEGLLYRLPFEALPAPASDGHGSPLITDYAISYVPSATTLAALAGKPPTVSPRLDLIAFADPAPLPGIPISSRRSSDPSRSFYETEGLAMSPLPHAAEEARRIRRYAARGSEVFTGREASERRVKEESLDRFRILHFATHGLVSARYPERSALVLASSGADGEDGFLQAREISDLKLDCDAVVLSACQTARGRLLAGEGVQGLARAFLYAGAHTVVASLWNVNDRRTADLMSAFYRALSRRASKVEALRQAKLELLSRPDSASPRNWAGFVLIGEGDEPIDVAVARSSGRWIFVAATVLAGALAFAGVRRWRREPGTRRP
jgi:CHAT domain-containing protein